MQMMEAHIADVEARMRRRESEITSQLEEHRVNSRLDRSRLIAQHDAELLEKDEQLLRFQNELERLVTLFRDQQSRSAADALQKQHDVLFGTEDGDGTGRRRGDPLQTSQ